MIQLNSSVKMADIRNARMISVYVSSHVLKIREGAILNLLILKFIQNIDFFKETLAFEFKI